MDGHVRHRIQARLRRPWPFGGDACGDRRLARTCVPRRDRIRRCCRSRLSSAGRRTHGGGDERSHREHEQDPCEDMHDPPAFVNRRAPAPRGRLSALRRVSTRFERSGRQGPGAHVLFHDSLTGQGGKSRGASPPRDGSHAIARFRLQASREQRRPASPGVPRAWISDTVREWSRRFAMARDASVLTVAGLATASDEDHASAGARPVPASLLHPWKAAATGSLSPSMPGSRWLASTTRWRSVAHCASDGVASRPVGISRAGRDARIDVGAGVAPASRA